jgi:hypothetical protein
MKTEEDEAFDELARKQGDWGGGFQAKRAMAADKLQEPAQEPVARYIGDGSQGSLVQLYDDVKKGTDFYTTPPQRPWVGLTDDELADIWYKGSLDWMEFARVHEAALKEKNFD